MQIHWGRSITAGIEDPVPEESLGAQARPATRKDHKKLEAKAVAYQGLRAFPGMYCTQCLIPANQVNATPAAKQTPPSVNLRMCM